MPNRGTQYVRARWPNGVVLLFNRTDDAAAERALIQHCQRSSRRLLIAPAAGFRSGRQLAIQVHVALGSPVPPQLGQSWLTHWRQAAQLELFPESWQDTACGAEQLSLFPEEDARWARERYLTEHIFRLDEAADLMRMRTIAELYVLQAQALTPATWGHLRRLAEMAEVRLHLVLCGVSRVRAPLRHMLRGCRVRQWSLRGPSGRASPAWWAQDSYRAPAGAVALLPERLARPRTRAPYEMFRSAALALKDWSEREGAELHSFTGIPVVLPPRQPRISASRLAAALRQILARHQAEAEP